ncbi:MAG: hypothetical protein J0H74_11985 [Chitinophagaceae bacterium]|nr:hypothetical protein [Chitinophagaceae bacterium]
MPPIIIYLLKCQICLAIVWLFYQLLLRRLTFYRLNRWYLLGYACLSFLLPLVHIVLPEESAVTGKVQVISYIPVIIGGPAAKPEGVAFTGWDILLCVLMLGALFLTGRLLIRWLSLRRIEKEAMLMQGVVRDDSVMVYQVDRPIIPFSFGNAIYINSGMHTEKELEDIILHEYVHVRQRHTVDILLAELICILSWYNPFCWLIRHTIRQNLEFIADQQVLASGLNKKSYQYHLLKVAGEPVYRLANNFNFSSLKKRIVMMNKSKSARLHLLKFLFIVPLLGVLLVAFRDKVNISLTVLDSKAGEINIGRRIGDTTPVKSYSGVISLKLDSVKPMYIVDEVESEGGIKDLNAEDIAWISVLKKDSEFGARGVNGVILIYRKKYKATGVVRLKDGTKVKVDRKIPTTWPKKEGRDTLKTGRLDVHDQMAPPDQPIDAKVIVRDTLKLGTEDNMANPDELRKCLFILDGKVSSYDEVFKLSPGRIASINILKDKSAEAIYGSRGKDGVIVVTTKGPGFKGDATITSIGKGDTVTVRADTIQLHDPVKPDNR